MKQFSELLTDLFLKQRDKLVRAYENRFNLFESKMQVLFESKESCDCLERESRFVQVVMNLESEVAKLRQDYKSCHVLQEQILKGLNEMQKFTKKQMQLNSNSTNVTSTVGCHGDDGLEKQESTKTECDNVSNLSIANVISEEVESDFIYTGADDLCKDKFYPSADKEQLKIVNVTDWKEANIDETDFMAQTRAQERKKKTSLSNTTADKFGSTSDISNQRCHDDIMMIQMNSSVVEQDLLVESSFSEQSDIPGNSMQDLPDTVSPTMVSRPRFLARTDNFCKCGQCGASFPDSSTLKKHFRTKHFDSALNRFKCSFCSYSCLSRGNLENHTRVHTKERPFECPVCLKRFSQNGNLKMHMVTHNQRSYHSCHICGRKFRYDSVLKNHIDNMHSEVKSYVCIVCGLACNDAFSLKTHMMNHAENDQFKCQYCNKKFSQKGNLLRHEALHPGKIKMQREMKL